MQTEHNIERKKVEGKKKLRPYFQQHMHAYSSFTLLHSALQHSNNKDNIQHILDQY